jgi:hypothetical protein
MNCSRNSISIPLSFSREKPIAKYPLEFATQREASTDTTAVHFRSIDGGCHSEKLTSVTVKAGLHTCRPTACVALMIPIVPASSPDMHDRYMCWLSFDFLRDGHFIGGAEGSFTLHIAAAESAAYAKNPPAMTTKNPIAPRSSQ